MPVVFDGQRIGLPKGGHPSTHILKPAILTLEDSVLNECYCMALAKVMGLPTAKADVMAVADRSVLLVTRYDRFEGDDGQPVSIHQEAFCQALRVVPEMK